MSSKAARDATQRIGTIRRDHPLFDEQAAAMIDAALAPQREAANRLRNHLASEHGYKYGLRDNHTRLFDSFWRTSP